MDKTMADAECSTCLGHGIVDVGTCPDCLGTGDATEPAMACERFINRNAAKPFDEIEPHLLESMWSGKVFVWAGQYADQMDEIIRDPAASDEVGLCGANECGGCTRDNPGPCESCKLWLFGVQTARAMYLEKIVRDLRVPAASERDSQRGAL